MKDVQVNENIASFIVGRMNHWNKEEEEGGVIVAYEAVHSVEPSTLITTKINKIAR